MSAFAPVGIENAQVSGDVTLAYEQFGDAGATPLLLVMGLGAQMITWRDEFCAALAAHGLHVTRFDNRDVGLSTHFEGMPDLGAIMAGDTSSAPYTLEDLADDTAGLLDHLGLDSAHVAGASMGGMVAQTLAARAPERVRSLTSIMSTTGERAASKPSDAAMAMLIAPRPTNIDEAEERALESARVVGSPGMIDEDWVRSLARQSYERAFDPPGFARQLAAIWASGDRTEAVRGIRVPTLVVHGDADQLVPPAGGRATAAAIKGSELMMVEGMGHDLPRPLWPQITAAIAAHVERAEATAAATATAG